MKLNLSCLRLGRIAGMASSPTIPKSGLTLWLDSDDFSTITLNGSNVSQWDDKSGNDNHFAQSIASSQPLYTGQTINGVQAIDFDGSNDYLHNLALSINLPITVFIVIKQDSDPGEDADTIYDSSTGRALFAYDGRSIADFYRIATTGGSIIKSEATANLTPHYYTFVYNGASSEMSRDGVLLNSGDVGLPSASDFYLGSNITGTANFLDGKIGEFIIYERVLDSGEINQVESYLSNKWSL